MSHQQSYRPNVNRAVTRKWAQASHPDYGGDDWGDDGYDSYDDEPASAPPSQAQQPWINQDRRSFTNPISQRGPGRSSFDRGDERRYFSTSAGGGFESAYPTAQRPPIPEPQHDDQTIPGYRQAPPLHLNTTAQGPPPMMHHSAGPLSQGYPTHPNAPFSAPMQPSRRSESGSRPSMDLYGPPIPRSESRESSSSGRNHPPRKSSIGQQQTPDLPMFSQAEGPSQPNQMSGESDKPLPFIRPADIYKRIEEEREKERRSQDSSRPSIDSATGGIRDHSTGRSENTRDAPPSSTMSTSAVDDTERKLKPTLDTVPERKSEYGMENMLRSADTSQAEPESTNSSLAQRSDHPAVSRISTEVGDSRPAEIHSASSRYTDRVDAASASTFNSAFPSRMASQQDRTIMDDYNNSPTRLPEISRMSTFGSDLVLADAENEFWREPKSTSGFNESLPERSLSQNLAQANQPKVSSVSEKSEPASATPTDLEHKRSLGYRSAVRQAFENEGQTMNSPTASETLPRSNSASTSDISPIVSRRNDAKNDLPMTEDLTSQPIPEEPVEMRGASQPKSTESRGREEPLEDPPNLRGTSRRDSPSPARRPLSYEAPHVPEPSQATIAHQSSIRSPSDVRTAEAVSVNKFGPGDSARNAPFVTAVENERTAAQGSSSSAGRPAFLQESSYLSEQSSPSLPRTHSEEWREWSDARKEFNARHGIKDSNPTTPGAPSSGRPSPRPQATFPSQLSSEPQDTTASLAQDSTSSQHLGLRPSIPGGWQSYNTLPDTETPLSASLKDIRPPYAGGDSRTDSAESIPTATAPKSMDWRAGQTGPVNHPYPEAAAAGSALAGIFSGPALTQHTPRDSENNSIDEPYGPTGTNRDETTVAHDFGAEDHGSDAPATLSSAAARDFATKTDSSRSSGLEHPSDSQRENAAHDITTPAGIYTGAHEGLGEDPHSPSPLQSKAEDYPAPLRTSRSSMSQDHPRPSYPTVTPSSAGEDNEDSESLQQDIVRQLTPKTSHTEDPTTPDANRFAAANETPAHHEEVEDEDTTPRVATGGFESIHNQKVRSLDETESPSNQHERNLHEASPTVTRIESNDFESSATRTFSNDRPFLGQRFSFEDDDSMPRQATPPRDDVRSRSSTVGDNRTSIDKALPSRPAETTDPSHTDNLDKSTLAGATKAEDGSKSSPTSPVSIKHSENSIPPTTVLAATAPSASAHSQLSSPFKSFPIEKVVFRDIMNYSTSRERMQAFNDNRKLFAEPTGQLENWLTSMNTADHAEAFTAKGMSQQVTPSSPNPGRTPPRRTTGVPSGTKQMQEDGKKLLATAGKYGGKAGIAAKGLFAKGKDKLRTVSAGEKATQSNRRRTSGVAITAPPPPSTIPESQHSSLVPASAPQIPDSQLAMTPLDEGSWSLFANNLTNAEPSKTQENQTKSLKTQAGDQPPQALSPVSDSSIGPQLINKNFPSRSVSDASDRQVLDQGKEIEAPTIPRRNPNRLSIQENRPIQDISKQESAQPIPNNDSVALPRQRHERLHSLSVPQHRRNSSVSDVSSVSRDGDEVRNVITRTISPSLDDQSKTDSTPNYTQLAQNKENEAKQEKVATGPPLPPYDRPPQTQASRLPQGAQIIPVARLRNDQAPKKLAAQPRPFSFVGSGEDVLRQGVGKAPSDFESPHARQPSGRDQFIQQHNKQVLEEAARQGHADPVSQRNVSNSPLPSARRPPEELMRHKASQGALPPVTPAKTEEAYRIPGPYVQEFRSPRQRTSQQYLVQTQSPQDRASRTASTQDMQPQPQVGPPPTQPVNISSPQSAERSRKISIGNIFGNRSRSQSRDDPDRRPQPKERRRSLLRLQSSPDEHKNVPSDHTAKMRESSGRKLSDDLLAVEPETKPPGKKKRFSGLFSKTPNKEAKPPSRASLSSVQSFGAYNDQIQQPEHPQTPQSQQNQRGPPSSLGRYQNPPHQSFRGVPPPPGGYYGSPPSDYGPGEDRQSAVSRDSSSHQSIQSANAWSQQQIFQPTHTYAPYHQQPVTAVVEQRPDLKIDTRSHQYSNIMSAPPAATYATRPAQYPPQTRANKDISYGQDKYNRSQSTITQHVKDLHMKSRSPRLRPRSSDELIRVERMSDEGSMTASLGTFMNKKVSPVGGAPRSDEEQEKPWTIGLPGEEQAARQSAREPARDSSSASSAKAREVRRILLERSASPKSLNETENRPQTVADRFMGAPAVTKSTTSSSPSANMAKPVPPSSRKDEARSNLASISREVSRSEEPVSVATEAKEQDMQPVLDDATTPRGLAQPGKYDHPAVAELSGSKPDGYESEEEIVMSATSYPGQEWQPVFERWED